MQCKYSMLFAFDYTSQAHEFLISHGIANPSVLGIKRNYSIAVPVALPRQIVPGSHQYTDFECMQIPLPIIHPTISRA
jgi:hypothetical protein